MENFFGISQISGLQSNKASMFLRAENRAVFKSFHAVIAIN